MFVKEGLWGHRHSSFFNALLIIHMSAFAVNHFFSFFCKKVAVFLDFNLFDKNNGLS